MKIFVISLPEALERRAKIARQMLAKGLEYGLVDGVRVAATSSSFAELGYCETRRLARYGYGLSPGEIGCFLAHRAAWRLVSLHAEKCLILEDDTLIEGLNPELLKRLQHGPHALVRLAGVFEKTHKSIGATGYSKYWGDPSGAAAYVLGRQEALRLLEASEKFYMAVDDFLEACHLHGLNTHAVLPYPVWQANVDSYITDRPAHSTLSAARRLQLMLVRMPIDIHKYIRRVAYYYF